MDLCPYVIKTKVQLEVLGDTLAWWPYSFVEDHRGPVVGTLLQYKHNVARHYGQLVTGLRNEQEQDGVGFSFQSPVKTADVPEASRAPLAH